MRAPALTLLLVACADGAAAEDRSPRAEVSTDFWGHWGDGRAELDAYRLRTPRYGALRDGRAVLVFVTETFTDAQRVKSDGGHADEYPVLKLNEIREFQTGLYDYDTMTSTFVRLDGRAPRGVPVKVSLSVQEWCGHVYEQLVPRGDELAWTSHSYFDGEADRERALALPEGAVLLDALPIVVRGLVGELPEGPSPALPTLLSGRIAHRDPSWTHVTFTSGPGTSEIEVPAGRFTVRTVTSAVAGGVTTTWQVEAAPPHRVIRWEGSDGEVAELVGSERVAYWRENREGDEAQLLELGLEPTAW